MTYISLARKYRPSNFDELLGQDAAVKALANAISLGREPHALLFTGTRGIGKTTTARLYAKALNCEQGPTPNPCNHCPSCLAINDSCHEDVHEIDGASHTGVDDVRELQESLSYVPQRSGFRIFIIDEVHMLSQSAFNALLKTLEEPPRHVVFVFATTELTKVPATVLSRCQLYHLQCLSPEKISQRLIEILNSEGVRYQKSTVHLISEYGRGSMRDALTFLDQVIALGGGEVNDESLRGLVSKVDSGQMLLFMEALLDKDPKVLIEIVASWEDSGQSLQFVVDEICRYCRHAMIVKELGFESLGVTLLGDDMDLVGRIAEKSKSSNYMDLNRMFRMMLQCRSELSGSSLDRFVLENNVLEWCFDSGLPNIDDIISGAKVDSPYLRESQIVSSATSASSGVVSNSNANGKNLKDGWQSIKDQIEKKKDSE